MNRLWSLLARIRARFLGEAPVGPATAVLSVIDSPTMRELLEANRRYQEIVERTRFKLEPKKPEGDR